MAGHAARYLGRSATLRQDLLVWIRRPSWYFAGDAARYDAAGDIWVLGRTDDVMTVSGHRIATAEIE